MPVQVELQHTVSTQRLLRQSTGCEQPSPLSSLQVQVTMSQPSIARHCASVAHSTHAGALGLPLQTTPPFWLQGSPGGSGGNDGVPLVQTLSVHWLPSTGRSASCTCGVGSAAPMPLHTRSEERRVGKEGRSRWA